MATGTEAPEKPADPGVSPRRGARTTLHAPSGRTILVRLEAPWKRALVLVLTLAGAAWVAKVIVSPAIADELAKRAASREDVEHALSWDPGNPDLELRVGRLYLEEGSLEEAREHLYAALRGRPTHSWTWYRLALLADAEGNRARARQAYETALRMDRHNVWLRWELALLALRWGERQEALEHLRYVLEVDPAQRESAFQLARALLGSGESVLSLLPKEAEPLTGILAHAVRHKDLTLAQAAWERRAPLAPGIPRDLQRQYLDLLVREGQGPAARRLWLAMLPNGHPGSTDNAVWNGGFEADSLLGWGLDWQVQRTWGVEVSLDRFVAARGKQSLRLSFNSFPTLDFAGVGQPVVVEPGREYALRAMAKALDFTTQSGLKLQVVTADGERVLAETRPLAGTTADWVSLETRVRVPAETSLVRVRLRREKAPGPEGNLGGKVWLDEVTLTRLGSVSLFPTGGEGGGEGVFGSAAA